MFTIYGHYKWDYPGFLPDFEAQVLDPTWDEVRRLAAVLGCQALVLRLFLRVLQQRLSAVLVPALRVQVRRHLARMRQRFWQELVARDRAQPPGRAGSVAAHPGGSPATCRAALACERSHEQPEPQQAALSLANARARHIIHHLSSKLTVTAVITKKFRG
jgi:hypothetical protein